MVVPAAYGDTGLKKVNIGVGKKRYTGLKVCEAGQRRVCSADPNPNRSHTLRPV